MRHTQAMEIDTDLRHKKKVTTTSIRTYLRNEILHTYKTNNF